MQETRGQQIDRQIEKYEEMVGDLLRYYDNGLHELVAGGPDDDDKKAEIQIACLLTMSYATRAVIAMKDFKIAYDNEVIDNLHELLKKADPNFKPLEEVYAEQNKAEEEAEDDNDDLESE